MATYDVRLNGANPYVKNGQNRVAVELNNGLVAHITDKQFAWYFKDVKVDECTGVSAMVTFFDKGEKNIIRDKTTKEIVKETIIDADNVIVKNIALIRGKLAIETVATAMAISMERKMTVVNNAGVANVGVSKEIRQLGSEIKAGDIEFDDIDMSEYSAAEVKYLQSKIPAVKA